MANKSTDRRPPEVADNATAPSHFVRSESPEIGVPESTLSADESSDSKGRMHHRAHSAASSTVPRGEIPPLGERTNERYELIGEHGRGGIGRVLRARDTDLGREVAVKELLVTGHQSEQRFVREAVLTARLQHPGIVPVHDVGRWPNGTPFYTMKLIQGATLRANIEQRQTLAERLQLIPAVIAIADAVAHAHERGVIHRDLKPSNVIIGDLGETVVIDWGLAKELHQTDPSENSPHPYREDAGATRTGAVLGTLGYMSPEQASSGSVDRSTDIYSVGAVLYAVATGRPPFAGLGSEDLLLTVRTSRPAAATHVEPSLPADLNAIIERAMAHDPKDRYSSMRQLGDDLRRYQSGQLVRAFDYTFGSLLRRWIRRHRLVLTLFSAMALVATAGGAFAILRIIQERNHAETQRREAEVARQEAISRGTQLVLARAEAEIRNDPTIGLEALDANLPTDLVVPQLLDLALAAIRSGLPEWRRTFNAGSIMCSLPGRPLTAVYDGHSIFIVEHTRGEIAETWSVPPVDSSRVMRCTTDGTVLIGTESGRLIELSRGESPHLRNLGHGPVSEIVLSPDENAVAVGFETGGLLIEDRKSGYGSYRVVHRGPLYEAKFHGPQVYSVGRDGTCQATNYDLRSPLTATKPRAVFRASVALTAVEALSDGVAVSTASGEIWHIGRKEHARRVATVGSLISRMRRSAQSEVLFVITEDFRVISVSPLTGAAVGHGYGSEFAVAGNGDFVVIAQPDGSLRFKHVSSPWYREVKAGVSPATFLNVASDDRVLSLSREGSLRSWNRAQRPRHVLPHTGLATAVDTHSRRQEFLGAADTGDVFICTASLDCKRQRFDMFGGPAVRLGETGEPSAVAGKASGRVYAVDDNLEVLASWLFSSAIHDLRLKHPWITVTTVDGALNIANVDSQKVTPVRPCSRVLRTRWRSGQYFVAVCADGSVHEIDASGAVQRKWESPTPLVGTPLGLGAGPTRTVVTYSSGLTYDFGIDVKPTALCLLGPRWLFEMSDVKEYATTCGGRVTLLEDPGGLTSPSLADDVISFDGSSAQHRLLLGGNTSITSWDYKNGTLSTVGAARSVQDAQMLSSGPNSFVAVSGVNGVEVWTLDDPSSTVPTSPAQVRSWLAERALNFN
jgi:Protein kinase domain